LTVEESCPTCGEDEKLRRSCTHCRTTGTVQVNKKIAVYGDAIIVTVGQTGKRQSNTTAKKTPRSPTIEAGHMMRSIGAYGKGSETAIERINEYEILTLKERIRLLVAALDLKTFEAAWTLWESDTSKEFPLVLRSEPVDDARKGEGRRFDYGRPV
jgi:DnaJ-class molecular chaperone